MELKPGKLLKVSYTNSKYSLTTVSGASSTSDGLRRFPTRSSGKRPTTPVEEELKRRKWRWIGQTLRKPKHNITRQALQWNPQGKRGRGRPRNTRRRDFIAEMEIEGYRWQDLERMAQNRIRWRTVVNGLCLDQLTILNVNKPAGPDGVSPRLLKDIADSISKPLTKNFNMSLSIRQVPLLWKIARVSPIFKGKGNPHSPQNYRPISVTSIVCKIMENNSI